MISVLDENYKMFFNEFPTLETKRFHLREIKEENFDDIYKIFEDDEVMRFSGINIVEPFKQTKNYIKTVSLMYRKKQGIRWGIYDKLNDNFVGDIGIFNINGKENSVEIGYIISKKYWRKYVGTECSKEIINFVFNELDIKKIVAIIDAENIPSIKLIKKLEFKMQCEFTQLAFNKFRRRYYSFSIEK